MAILSEMDRISVAEMKAKLSEKLKNVEKRNRRYLITSHGKAKAVVISYKEYLALTQDRKEAKPKEISLDEWKKEKKERDKVISAVSAVFDTDSLSRKGQKEYKKNVVKKSKK